jgi:hypothetical protein
MNRKQRRAAMQVGTVAFPLVCRLARQDRPRILLGPRGGQLRPHGKARSVTLQARMRGTWRPLAVCGPILPSRC